MISYSSEPLKLGEMLMLFANGLPALIDYNINYAQNDYVTILVRKEKIRSESLIVIYLMSVYYRNLTCFNR